MQVGILKSYELYQVENGWGFLKHNIFQIFEGIQNASSSYWFQCGKDDAGFNGAESNKALGMQLYAWLIVTPGTNWMNLSELCPRTLSETHCCSGEVELDCDLICLESDVQRA